MKISEIITDKYKLRIPPTVYYDLLADVREVEDQEPLMVEIDLYSVIKQKYIERDVLDKIRAEIDRQQKWLLQAGYTAYNVDIVLDAIKSVVAESEVQDADSD